MASKSKTISGPYQSYQIRVSVSTIAELQTMQPPGVDGAPTFFRDNGLPWFWFSQLPAGYTSSADGHTGATFGKSGFYVSLFALTAAAALGAFLTVARASASRMLDVPASTLYLVKDGARTYVQSFVSGWHWEANFPAATATDNEATCRPIAWATLGLNGAFVRDLQGDDTARGQAAWVVDRNAADNEGTGSALDPLKSDNEIGRRWGSGQTPLRGGVTISYVNSPTGVSNFDVLLLPGSSIRWVGSMAAPVTTDVLTAVTVQNRATQTQWDITAPTFGASAVRKFARITQSATPGNVGAYATVLKDLTGGRLRTTSFGLATVFSPGFVVVTPAIGDTVEIIEPSITLQPGRIAIESGINTLPSSVANCFVFDSLKLGGTAFGSQQIIANGAFGGLVRVDVASQRFGGRNSGTFQFLGGSVSATSRVQGGGNLNTLSTAIFATIGVSPGGTLLMQQDTTFQGVGTAINMAAGSDVQSFGTAYFDSASNGCVLDNNCNYLQIGGVADWGTANGTFGLRVRSGARYVYATRPTINAGLGAGRESVIGGVDTQYAAYPATGAVNATNLAAAVLSA